MLDIASGEWRVESNRTGKKIISLSLQSPPVCCFGNIAMCYSTMEGSSKSNIIAINKNTHLNLNELHKWWKCVQPLLNRGLSAADKDGKNKQQLCCFGSSENKEVLLRFCTSDHWGGGSDKQRIMSWPSFIAWPTVVNGEEWNRRGVLSRVCRLTLCVACRFKRRERERKLDC